MAKRVWIWWFSGGPVQDLPSCLVVRAIGSSSQRVEGLLGAVLVLRESPHMLDYVVCISSSALPLLPESVQLRSGLGTALHRFCLYYLFITSTSSVIIHPSPPRQSTIYPRQTTLYRIPIGGPSLTADKADVVQVLTASLTRLLPT